MELEGALSTPLGPVKKKTALIVGGAAVLIVIVVWLRSRNATTVSEDINPATGYPFGSQEDLDALAAQANTPTGSGGGGDSGSSQSTGFISNADWSQQVLTYMVENGIVVDPGPLSTALGKYISGQPLTNAEQTLITQAIAFKGTPPNAGPNGYPPNINTAIITSSPTPPGTPTPSPGRVAGYHAIESRWPGPNSTVSQLTLSYRTSPSITWQQAWNDAHNASIRTLRGRPENVRVGDKIWIP